VTLTVRYGKNLYGPSAPTRIRSRNCRSREREMVHQQHTEDIDAFIRSLREKALERKKRSSAVEASLQQASRQLAQHERQMSQHGQAPPGPPARSPIVPPVPRISGWEETRADREQAARDSLSLMRELSAAPPDRIEDPVCGEAASTDLVTGGAACETVGEIEAIASDERGVERPDGDAVASAPDDPDLSNQVNVVRQELVLPEIEAAADVVDAIEEVECISAVCESLAVAGETTGETTGVTTGETAALYGDVDAGVEPEVQEQREAQVLTDEAIRSLHPKFDPAARVFERTTSEPDPKPHPVMPAGRPKKQAAKLGITPLPLKRKPLPKLEKARTEPLLSPEMLALLEDELESQEPGYTGRAVRPMPKPAAYEVYEEVKEEEVEEEDEEASSPKMRVTMTRPSRRSFWPFGNK
jgi:hypothetical protein